MALRAHGAGRRESLRIALQYGLNVDELALFNCIPDPALIRVGQQIYIP